LLRLSVTDRCNFRCAYCIPPEGVPGGKTPLPSLENLADAALFLIQHTGERQVKLTGGEPTLRRDLPLLVHRLASHPQIDEISMTCNGSRLRETAAPLRVAGLKRINTSLDSLNPARFKALTHGSLNDTLDGIDAALEVGFNPLKLNAVLRRSYWKEDVTTLLDFAADRDLELRFIELMQTGTRAEWASAEFIPANEVQHWLKERADAEQLPYVAGETSRRWKLNWWDREIHVGWITPQSHAFCDGCKRIRLDAHGQVRRCLMDDQAFPLLEKLETQPEDEVLGEFNDYLQRKQPPAKMGTASSMTTVGG
jgi:GTP 3',8-cyclase